MKSFKAMLLASLLFVMSFVGCTYNEQPVYSTTYSDTYYVTINWNQWIFSGDPGHWYTRLHIPNITPAVVDNGLVIVYYRNSANNWVMLPYSTTLYNEVGYQFAEEIWFGYAVGTLDIDYVYTDPMNMTPHPGLMLKIILMRL